MVAITDGNPMRCVRQCDDQETCPEYAQVAHLLDTAGGNVCPETQPSRRPWKSRTMACALQVELGLGVPKAMLL